MSSFEFAFPDVSYEKEDVKKYEELVTANYSPFQGYNRAELFIFAMAYAYNTKMQPQKLKSPQPNMPQDAFKPNMRNLMRALAISYTDSLDVIKDHSKVVQICEEFANAGFKHLYGYIVANSAKRKDDLLDELIRKAEQSRNQS